MTLLVLSIVALGLAAVPAVVFASNWRRFAPPPPSDLLNATPPRVSLLIPARDEAAAIGPCLDAAVASIGVHLEVIVLDDGSRDDTAGIVGRYAATDPRVRLERAPPLPDGWCGKQHACHALARLAAHDTLAFIDADVRLAPDALSRAVAFLDHSGSELVSGFPRQVTGSFLERLLLPLIHFVLLGFLPIGRMRRSTAPAYGAGCGQWFVTRKGAYDRAGGHAVIRASLHDGVMLPRAYRRAGLRTDLFDATGLAECRMYAGAAQTWHGLAKNATEGMAAPAAIVPWTVLLLGGQVLPIVLLIVMATAASVPPAVPLAVAGSAAVAGYAVRFAAAARFRQSWLGATAHPLGVVLLVAVQWYALARHLIGRPASWRGRLYPPRPG
ncbi:MAG TPA: glycosyltransferase family 2 protein [Tepidisphaeraceae bacterium]|nr:glycosyltransferase family 2 protein [Tepidisphaeraceae bacterium]